ncbi:alpha/beta hydrolase [Emticicia agri]|uniref:Alpha/beta fold hydrolase n=1 Tax=Emticicia agri TaxID=2492393 RepID=A0A4Q5LUE6_9BACT|nr:alpha/beta fold hydrolase [Emticicia agri]RYU93155.1 alpha/beta fold hydrolase [Emticicia agri]
MVKKIITIALIIYASVFGLAVLFQRFILLHPDTLEKGYAFEFEDAQEFYVEPVPKINLNALMFLTRDTTKKGVVMYLHGNSRNIKVWGKYAKEFTSRGYDVIMYDYRGFGKSNGRLDEANLLSDAQTVLKDIQRRYPPRNIIIYGRSLGTGVATKLAMDNEAKMLILEAPYTCIPDVAWSHAPLFPYSKVCEFQLPTHEWITKVKCPIYLFHGTDDQIIPYEHSLKLTQLLKKNPKDILTTLEGGRHRGLDKYKEYQAKMDEILK